MKNIELGTDDKKVLLNIQKGFDVMSELVDITGWPGERVNAVIEKLDRSRLIERDSLTSIGFWKFHLTSIGESLLPELDAKEKALSKYEMYNVDQQILKETEKRGRTRAVEIVENLSGQLPPLELAVSIVKLIRLGCLNESGFLRRFIEITPKGIEILKRIA